MDDKKQAALDHLKTHVTYPATTEAIMEACSSWSDVDAPLMEEAKGKLEAGKTWNSSDDVVAALGWSQAPAAGGDMGGAMPPGGATV